MKIRRHLAAVRKSAFELLFCALLRFLDMFFLSGLIALDIYVKSLFAAYLHRHFYRKTVRVVKSKRSLAVELAVLDELQHLVKLFYAVFQRLGKLVNLLFKLAVYLVGIDFKLCIHVLILSDVKLSYIHKSLRLDRELTGKSYASAYKSAKYVSLVYVGRHYTSLVAKHKRRGADMVCDYTHGSRIFAVFAVLLTRQPAYLVYCACK